MVRAPEHAHRDWVWTRNKVREALARYGQHMTIAEVRADVVRRLEGGGPTGPTPYYTMARRWGLTQLDATCAKARPGDAVTALRQRLNELVEDPRHPGYREAF